MAECIALREKATIDLGLRRQTDGRCDKATGKQVGEVRLEAAPAFNGMGATGSKAYLSLASGTLVCLE